MEYLPKDQYVAGVGQKEADGEIRSVSDYIRRISEYVEEHHGSSPVVVYRGEPQIYEKPCLPNIFRKGYLERSVYFEKSLFDAMRPIKLSGDTRYLDNAIDAQHGEFPSRLLDVTYNCLAALYFAVTPYYHYEADSLDGCDGMVYVFFIDDIFSPSAENTNDNYNAIINRDQPWYQGKSLFEKTHKFVDFAKLNDRIIAQRGAFILFPGDAPEELPRYMSSGLRIPGGAKARMRRELKQFFGIHTGSIYPESMHLVEDLSEKSIQLNTDAFNFKNELNRALVQFERELEYYFAYAEYRRKENAEHRHMILQHTLGVIRSYEKGLLELMQDQCVQENPDNSEALSGAAERYDAAVAAFADRLDRHGLETFDPGTCLLLI